MMHTLLIFIAMTSIAITTPLKYGYDTQAAIISFRNENDGHGNYDFSYETTNLIRREESGRVVNIGKSNEHIVITGQTSFLDPEGKYVEIKYVADENGFRILPTTKPYAANSENEPFSASIPAKFPLRSSGGYSGGYSPNVVATMLGG